VTTFFAAPTLRPHITKFDPRGPVSELLLAALSETVATAAAPLAAFSAALEDAISSSPGLLTDDDLQLTLFLLYGLSYGDVVDADDRFEWNPATIAARVALESAFEQQLRALISVPSLPHANSEAVAAALFELTSADTGPSLSRFVASRATREQLVELVVQRSIYTLKEADPHSWAIPRLGGRAKVAMVEIQADEYGGGRPERMHATIFAGTMRGLGLDDSYGTYVDNVPAIVLASFNMMSMFGLNRRLRGAISGHLAAFEMTSSIPNGLYARGFRRHGFGEDVTWYFDEHVEADAVHEQIAARDLAGGLAESEPQLLADIMFGAAACLAVDSWVAEHLLTCWTDGRSSLRRPLEPFAADDHA
jgi:Iron-containing redox enzyme